MYPRGLLHCAARHRFLCETKFEPCATSPPRELRQKLLFSALGVSANDQLPLDFPVSSTVLVLVLRQEYVG